MAMGPEGRRFTPTPSSEVKRGRRETLPIEERPLVRGVSVDSNDTREAKRTKHRDDAFWMERTPTGYDLIVSITDVAAAVPHNSAFDLRARRNDKKGAMLRPFGGKDLRDTEVGLTSNAERLSVSTTFSLDNNFDIVGAPKFELTRIKLETRGELAHEEVTDLMQDPDHEMSRMFRDLATAAVNLRERREHKGAIPSTKLPPDRDWQRTNEGTIKLDRYDDPILPNIMVQEIMDLNNAAGTSYIIERNYPAIFKGRDLRDGQTQREEIIDDLDSRKEHLSQRKYKEEVEWLIGTQTESFYSPFPELNVVLNEPHAQNSSPMRKYDALINQRVLIAAIKGEPPPYSAVDLNRICRRLNSSPELNHIHPGERVSTEVPKGITKDQRIQRKLKAELKDKEYTGEKFQELKIRTERRKAEHKRLVGDEKLMDGLLGIEDRLKDKSSTKVVYRRVKNIGPRGERIPVNGRERSNGKVKDVEIFPGKKKEDGPCIVSINTLNKFKGDSVTVDSLIEQGFVSEIARETGVRIHGTGRLKKGIEIIGISMTKNAAEKVKRVGGSLHDVPKSERAVKIQELSAAKAEANIKKKNGDKRWWDKSANI